MFVDKKSECLIRYLAENEPTKVDGKYIYPVSQLVSSFDSDQNHWSAGYLKPYLVTLQEQELVTSFDFPNRYSVHIEPTARLLHFDEYQSADATDVSKQPNSNTDQNTCPDSSSEAAKKTSWYRDAIGLNQAMFIVAILGLIVAVAFGILGLVF